MKKYILPLIGGLLVATVYLAAPRAYPEGLNAKVLDRLSPDERRHAEATTARNVSDDFVPAVIVRFNPDTGLGSIVGSGTLLSGSNGLQLATAAHVFRQDFGEASFLVRRLRPFDEICRFTVARFNPADTNLPDPTAVGNDAVLCQIEEPKSLDLPKVRGLYDPKREELEGNGHNEITALEPQRQARLRSLVTGIPTRVVAVFGDETPGELTRCLVPLASQDGDSGRGFVDDEGSLYILKGQVTKLDMPDEGWQRIGLPRGTVFSMVLGPFRKN